MTPGEFVDLAVAIELECASLYEVFAKNFQGREDIVYFWKLYAEAERYHAASIRIHQATFIPEEGASAGLVDSGDARKFLDELRDMRNRYEREPLTISSALTIARHIEDSSAELHGRTQFFAQNPEMYELFTKMAEEDRTHREMLATAERRFTAAA